jgi:hypothetical protein
MISAKGRNGTVELLEVITNQEDDRIPAVARFSLEVLARQYAAIAADWSLRSVSMAGTDRVRKAGGSRKPLALARSLRPR